MLLLLATGYLLASASSWELTPSEEQSPVRSPEVSKHGTPDAPILALTQVRVLDGTGQPARQNQTIVVEGSKIVETGPAQTTAIPPGAQVLRLAGHTVIPGLVGMHNHTHMPGAPELFYSSARLNLAAGVTTIQTAGSAAAEKEIQLALDIEAGRSPGPRIVPSAPYITGPGGNAVMEQPVDAEAATAFVETWIRAGAKWFKLYRHTTPEVARAVIGAAHRKGARVTAHPCTLTFGELADMGIDRIEHGLLSVTDFHTPRKPSACPADRLPQLTELDLDSPAVQALLKKLVDRRVALTSTLAIAESHFAHRPQGDARSLRALSPERVQAYERRQIELLTRRTPYSPALFQKILAFELAFVRAGGQLVAGPDTGRHVLAGFGDQRNYELLVEAGFEPAEAIQIMTSNGASALGLDDEIGSITAGLESDMVVLRGDLTADPTVIRQVERVFKSGRAFDPQKLLAEVDGRVGRRSDAP